MNVIKISGSSSDIDIIKSNNEDILKGNIIFILDEDKYLHEFLEKLEIDGELLFNLKIANDVYFHGINNELSDRVTGEKFIVKSSSLSDLLKTATFEEIKESRLIFDMEDSNFISGIIQALIYLDIELEVMMKKESSDRKILNAFRRRYESLRYSALSGGKELQKLYVADEFINEMNELINTIFKIQDDLEKARERELNIAVMATKKAGKSVIVNSFLKEQYAPTSLELPTPNNCIYRRSKDNSIRLLYGNNDIIFKNPKMLYDYIYREFKRAQNDKASGCTIQDMEIFYSSPSSGIGDFTLIDTPGSNYVAAKSVENGENIHKKRAYEWIEKSDVVLFLINYSNYLTVDEEDFFRSIKQQFEKQDKFYSLIIVVNKLDEMYISEFENKSVVRFLDYIRSKLLDLGYKSVVVIGTSARTYFDVLKTIRIDENTANSIENYKPIKSLENRELRDRMIVLKQKFIGMAEMSSLSFVDNQLENLECFHAINNYNLETLIVKSGIPKLEKYTEYVGMQKANIELYRSIISDIDKKYVKISNKSKINKFTNSLHTSSEQIKKLESMIRQINERFNVITCDLESKLNFNDFRNIVLQGIKEDMDCILEHMLDIGEARVDEYFMKLLLKTSEELKSIKNRTVEIEFTVNKKLFADELNGMIEKYVLKLKDEIKKREHLVRHAEINMSEIVNNFSYVVRGEYNLKDFDITMPKIDQSFNKNIIQSIPGIDINDEMIKEKICNSIEFKKNPIQSIINSFRKDKQGTYYLNSEKLRRVNLDYIEQLKNAEYGQYYEMLKDTISTNLKENTDILSKVFNEILVVYENIFDDLLRGIANIKEKSEKQMMIYEKNLEFYTDVDKKIESFNDFWEEVRRAGV
jgi:hypothetical protein